MFTGYHFTCDYSLVNEVNERLKDEFADNVMKLAREEKKNRILVSGDGVMQFMESEDPYFDDKKVDAFQSKANVMKISFDRARDELVSVGKSYERSYIVTRKKLFEEVDQVKDLLEEDRKKLDGELKKKVQLLKIEHQRHQKELENDYVKKRSSLEEQFVSNNEKLLENVDKLGNDNRDLSKRLSSVTSEKDLWMKKHCDVVTEMDDQFFSYERAVEVITNTNNELGEHMASVSEKNNVLEEVNNSLNAKCEDLQETIDGFGQLVSENSQLRNHVEKMRNEWEVRENQFKEVIRENNGLRNHVESLYVDWKVRENEFKGMLESNYPPPPTIAENFETIDIVLEEEEEEEEETNSPPPILFMQQCPVVVGTKRIRTETPDEVLNFNNNNKKKRKVGDCIEYPVYIR